MTESRAAGIAAPGSVRKQRRTVDGVLLLDKPIGPSSNQALQTVKRLYAARKAGHTGSLDPLASGMLPLCFGQATKISSFLLESAKVYTVTALFGARTSTGDTEGEVVARSPVTTVTREDLESVLAAFRGDIQQIPPMYSALKQGGRRLYELARQGQEVVREPRQVCIHELEIETYEPTRPTLRVRCSKGTYVRTLVEDIARACGTEGHVVALRRLAVQPFAADGMVTMAELESAAGQGELALDALLRPVDEAIQDWPLVRLGPDEAYYLRQGHPVTAPQGQPPGRRVRIYDQDQVFLGIGEMLADGRVAPRRLLSTAGGGA